MTVNNRQQIKRCALLLLAGTALQLLSGGISPSFLRYPWGVVMAVNYLYLLVMLYAFSGRMTWIKTLYNKEACISSMMCLLLLTILLGVSASASFTSSWIFCIFLLYFMTAIGLRSIDDIYNWRHRKPTTTLFHLSFFILLAASTFGSGDKQRVSVTAVQGQPVSSGIEENGIKTHLPFQLRLKDFSIEEYPPQLHILKNELLSDEFLSIEHNGSYGELGGWSIECEKYLEEAGRMSADSDYIALNHVGATTAIYIKAKHTTTGKATQGWISCGSHIFSGNALPLPDGSHIIMPRREPKKYSSKVDIQHKGVSETIDIEVNKPATVGNWKIYQKGYNTEYGRWSTVSVLECVNDGWYIIIQASLWLTLLTGAYLFLFGWRNRKNRKEDNV